MISYDGDNNYYPSTIPCPETTDRASVSAHGKPLANLAERTWALNLGLGQASTKVLRQPIRDWIWQGYNVIGIGGTSSSDGIWAKCPTGSGDQEEWAWTEYGVRFNCLSAGEFGTGKSLYEYDGKFPSASTTITPGDWRDIPYGWLELTVAPTTLYANWEDLTSQLISLFCDACLRFNYYNYSSDGISFRFKLVITHTGGPTTVYGREFNSWWRNYLGPRSLRITDSFSVSVPTGTTSIAVSMQFYASTLYFNIAPSASTYPPIIRVILDKKP